MNEMDEFRQRLMDSQKRIAVSVCFEQMYSAKTEQEVVERMREADKLLNEKDPW